MKHIRFSGVVPVGCLYWEQRRSRMGVKGSRRVQDVGEQSRIIFARVSLSVSFLPWVGMAGGGKGPILLLPSQGFWDSQL